jgi:hypothetical protein
MFFDFEKILENDVKVGTWKIKALNIDMDKKTVDVTIQGFVSQESKIPVLEEHMYLSPKEYPFSEDGSFEKQILSAFAERFKNPPVEAVEDPKVDPAPVIDPQPEPVEAAPIEAAKDGV